MRLFRAVPRPVLTTSAVAAVVLGGLVLPSAAGSTYTDRGTASLPSPVGFGATDLAFSLSCPDAGQSQGLDGWVFTLPAGYAGGTATVTAGGADVAAYVYDDSCAFLRSEADDAADLTVTLGATDRYLSVYASDTPQVTFDLTVEPGADPQPTATATATATVTATATSTAGPGALRTRHTYSATPNDPLYTETPLVVDGTSAGTGQWGMQTIQAAQAWQQPQATGAGVQVAVLDTGLDLGHPDLSCEGKVRIAAGATPDGTPPQDQVGHGTHVAGIIGACTDNGTGVVGVAPDATILPFRVLGPDGGNADDLAAALRAATDAGAHVINMSLGFGVAPGGLAQVPGSGSAAALVGLYADTIDPAVDYAVSKGVVVVAAAGNETFPLCGYPALADGVVCVGSTDRRDLPSWFSNFAFRPDGGAALVAPGGSGQVFCDLSSENILSTYARDLDACDEGAGPGYEGLDGTSMATPHVAGAAALVYDRLGAVRSPENAAKVKQALADSAVDLGAPGYDPEFGSGRLDALAAVQAVTSVTPSPTPTPTQDPVRATSLTLTAGDQVQRTDDLAVAVRLVDEAGTPVAGAPVDVTFAGASTTVTTGSDGTATTTVTTAGDPGQVELSASWAGSATTRPSGAHQAVQVLLEDTSLAAVLTAAKSKDTVTATLADADAPGSGVPGATLVLVDGKGAEVPATTDAQGRASWQVSGAYRAKSYDLRYAGDTRWVPSTTTAS